MIKEIDKPKKLELKNNILITAFIMFGMYASFGMSWMGVVPLFQDIETALKISHSEASWLISVISLAKSIFPVLAGILATKIGLTKSLRISSLLILTGIIIPWLPSYPAWLLARFLFGVGGAMWVTLMGAVTMYVFDDKQRPIVNAINGVAVNVGVILALWYTLPLSKALGWQNAFSLYSGISGIFALLLWLFINIPFNKTVSNVESPRYIDSLNLPLTWIISFAFTGPLALYLVFNTWLAIYYQEVFHIPKLQTMQWLSWMNLWGIPTAIATGFILRAVKKCKPFILAASIILPVASLMAVNINDPSILTIVLALSGVGMFLGVAPLVTLLQSQPNMNPSMIGMIIGTMFSITYILSSITPSIVGYCYNSHISLTVVLSMCCLLAFSPAIALVLKEAGESK
ncbi:MAG: MFS transporter [Candidatus Sericytochromatia bacterium]|nr:MFS transporter [Candidatus Sericytochromatia bacterium]